MEDEEKKRTQYLLQKNINSQAQWHNGIVDRDGLSAVYIRGTLEHGQVNKEHGLNNDPSTGQIKIEAWRMTE